MINEADVGLFFKIKADASEASAEISQLPEGLQKVLNKLAKQLSISEKAINSHSQRTKELGDSSARTANRLDNLSDNAKKLYGRIVEASAKFVSGEASAKQFSNAIRSVAAQSDNLRTRIKASASQIQDFQTKVENAARKTAALNFKNLQSNLSSLSSSLQNVGRNLSIALTLPLAGLGIASTKVAVDFESLKRGLTAVTGSAAEAEKQFVRLREVAKLPGLGFQEAVRGSLNLQAAGLTAKQAEAALKSFGNALATVGKGKSELDGVILALSQIQSKGKISAQEINQLAERVPQIRKAIEGAFGTSDSKKLQKLGISSTEFIDKITLELGKLPLVTGGAANSFENLKDTIELALLPLGQAILPFVIKAVEAIVPIIEKVSASFQSLSPTFQVVVVAIGGIVAAVGPVLIALSSIISAVSAVAGALTFITGTASIGAALSALAPIIAGVVVVVGTLAAVVTAFALAWANDFGKIRTITLEVFEDIKNFIKPALDAIYKFTEQIGGQIVDWWKANYPLIKETIETVSNAIEAFIKGFLDVVSGLWESHGESVTGYVSRAWERSKEIITSVIEVIGNILKLGMQIINGDWEGAWNTYLETLQGTIRTVVSYLNGYFQTTGELFLKIIALVVEYTIRFGAVLAEGMKAAITGAVYILATLPEQIEKLIPKLVAVGNAIGNAIWRGIQEGLVGRELGGLEGDIVRDASGSASRYGASSSVSGSGASGIMSGYGSSDDDQIYTRATDDKLLKKQQRDAEKAAKERERAANQEIADQITLLENQLNRAKELYRETFEDIKKEFDKTGKISLFDDELGVAAQRFSDERDTIVSSLLELEYQAATSAKKTATQFKILADEQKKRATEIDEFTDKIQEERDKIVTGKVKKVAEEKVKLTKQQLEDEVDLRRAADERVAAMYEKDAALDFLTAEQLAQKKRILRSEYEQFLLENLQRQLIAVKGNAEAEAAINKQIALQKIELDKLGFDQAKEAAETNKKNSEEQKKLELEVLAVKQDILNAERDLQDFRQEQSRKVLQNTVDSSFGKERLRQMEVLRDFDIAEELRKQQQRENEIEEEYQDALDRVLNKENEEQQLFEIEELYKQKRLLSEEEFQTRLKEIEGRFKEDRINSQTGQFGGGLFGGLMDSITAMSDELIPASEKINLALAGISAGWARLKETAGQAIDGMLAGIGQMVSSYVLLGNAGGQSLRKMVAQTLAAVASQAAVLAIFELAKGFAALFFNPAEATAHFTAAALFGSIAVGSALVGRAVAGNSFQNQSNNSFSGRANNSSTSGNFSGSSQTNEPITYDENRINRQESATKTYVFQVPRGMVSQAVMNDFNSAGPIRDGILRMVEG